MRLSALQMSPGVDRAANLDQARRLIEGALRESAPDLIALPEMWTCLGGDRSVKFAAAETLPPPGGPADAAGPAYRFLRDTAAASRITLHGGSIAERDGDRLFNTTLVFGPDGREIARYRKIHLFDITTPDGTGYRESAIFGAGETLGTFVAGDLLVGCAICYDLRFPELFARLRQLGAGLILVPAAFTVQTGRDHWEVLLRARAIETQCWIAAPATCGPHPGPDGDIRHTYGHASVCDPWGRVVARLPEGVGWAAAKIDPDLTAKVRADMPVHEHRRLN